MLNQNTLFFENIRVEHFTHPNKVKIPPPSCPLKTTLRCPSILWPVQVLPLTSLKRRKSWENLRNLRSIFGGFYPFFGKLNLQFLGQRLLTIRTSSGPNQLQDAERPTDTMSAEPGKLPGWGAGYAGPESRQEQLVDQLNGMPTKNVVFFLVSLVLLLRYK